MWNHLSLLGIIRRYELLLNILHAISKLTEIFWQRRVPLYWVIHICIFFGVRLYDVIRNKESKSCPLLWCWLNWNLPFQMVDNFFANRKAKPNTVWIQVCITSQSSKVCKQWALLLFRNSHASVWNRNVEAPHSVQFWSVRLICLNLMWDHCSMFNFWFFEPSFDSDGSILRELNGVGE